MALSKKRFLELQGQYYENRQSLLMDNSKRIDLRAYSWPDNGAGGPEWLRVHIFHKEALRVIGGEINWFLEHIKNCEAWKSVHESLSSKDKIDAFFFLMKDSFTLALLTPYALKQRFVFFGSHLLHYTRMVIDTSWHESKLPDDKNINIHTLHIFNKSLFKNLQPFLDVLYQLDSSDSQKDLLGFRHKYQHRDPVKIEHGLSAIIKREKNHSSTTSYGLGGTKPLPMEKAIQVVYDQHECALNCYKAFLVLLEELLEIWRKARPYEDYC